MTTAAIALSATALASCAEGNEQAPGDETPNETPQYQSAPMAEDGMQDDGSMQGDGAMQGDGGMQEDDGAMGESPSGDQAY
jgi:hypothetical protein